MDLVELVQKPEAHRDQEWERDFLQLLTQSLVTVEDDGQTTYGPDGWPYLKVRTGQGSEPVEKIVGWLAGRGIGLVVNAHKMVPDYVATYGMLWHFVETGRFIDLVAPAPEEFISDNTNPLIIGPPTDGYLPEYVRLILREYLGSLELIDAKILVATTKDYKQTDLIFSLEGLKQPTLTERKKIAEAIQWFLPLHYSLVFVAEGDLKGWVAL